MGPIAATCLGRFRRSTYIFSRLVVGDCRIDLRRKIGICSMAGNSGSRQTAHKIIFPHTNLPVPDSSQGYIQIALAN
jgi:hypothetical protein